MVIIAAHQMARDALEPVLKIKNVILLLAGWYSSDNSPLQIITYTECKFIEAEAEFRKGDKQTAYDAYMEGITANMEKMGVADTAITRYTTDPAVQ